MLLLLPLIASQSGGLTGALSVSGLSAMIAAKLGYSAATPAKKDVASAPSGAMAAVKAAVRAKGLIVLALVALIGFVVLLSAINGQLLGLTCKYVASACVTTATLPPTDSPTPVVLPRLHTYDEEVALPLAVVLVFAILLAVGLLLGRLIDTNRFSLHAMYRARLIRAYLGASRPAGARAPDPFTGFDEKDNRYMHEMQIGAGLTDSDRPLVHVVNIALNLVGGSNLARQERRADSFTVTSLHAGSHRLGYRRTSAAPSKPRFVRTERDKAKSPRPRIYGGKNGISLGTAITISGAAASPNMGYHSSAPVTFLMTLLNARLGWWLGNPGHAGDTTYDRVSPRLSVRPILAEMFGRTNDANAYVYLSDGGHFENLGLYEMVLRRCRCIVVVDASADEKCALGDLGSAVRKIRIDLGVPIAFKSDFALKPRTAVHKSDSPTEYCAIAEIEYACVDRPNGQGKPQDYNGKLIYIKPGFRGDESKDIYTYATGSAAFPHESTVDQFFSESQFESYRALGRHIVERILEDKTLKKEFEDCLSV